MSERARKGFFRLLWLPGIYSGYYFNGPADTWNGHPQPYFSQEERQRILTDIYDTYKAVAVETEDGLKILYPLGGQAWSFIKVN